ncbi:hypothetical protein LINGRAPRIM_LOCUS2281 [Linum grandiflorum]
MVRKIKMHQHRTKKLQRAIIWREESTLATRNKMKHEFQLCCDKVGYPDLFISFTCNSNWPEIEHMVNLVRHTEGNDPCHGLMLISMLNSATNQGCESFEDIRTVNDNLHESFKDTCGAYGFLADDGEWNQCLQEVFMTASARQLRKLFVTMIMYYGVSNVQSR